MKVVEPTPEMFEAAGFLNRLNDYRRKIGAPRVSLDAGLAGAAAEKLDCFERRGVEPIDHTCGGISSATLRRAHGNAYPFGSEILAWSERTADDVFRAWRSSPVHDAVMRDPQYRYVGIAGPRDLGRFYGSWCVEFSGEASAGVPQDKPDEEDRPTMTLKPSIHDIPAPFRTVGEITRDTAIRLIGDAPAAVIRGVLDYAKSPAMAEFDDVYAAIAGHSVALTAIMAKETEYGRTANGERNGWNTIDGGDGFTDYPTWQAGAKAAALRLNDYTYKGGIYEPDISVADFHKVWIGGPDCRATNYQRCARGESRNSIELAIAQFLDRANRIIAASGRVGSAKPTPNPTHPVPTKPVPGEPDNRVVFGRVPRPSNYAEIIIAPGVNTAYATLGARIPRGLILHRMIGTLLGTNAYFQNEARHRALTDFGLGKGADGKSGRVVRWTRPGAGIAPHASGPADGIDGDGLPFWNRYKSDPIGASIFNRDCESIEIEGLSYSSPVPSEDYDALVELVAWRADEWLRIPYNRWPLNNDGVHCLLGHSEVTDQKPCPGEVVYALVGELIEDVAGVLKRFQLGG